MRTRRRLPTPSGHPLEDHRHALPSADAHGLEAVLPVAFAKPVDERGRDPCTGHAERMAECDCAAVDVELVLIDRELARRGDHLYGERLVDLDEVDIVDG